MEFKFVSTSQLQALPILVGVYAFQSKEGILLYIGKAINIKERIKNHFQQPTFKDNIFIPETTKIGFIVTGSEIEALLLEAELIKKYQPKYNTVWRDGKSHNYVFITEEDFPRVFVGRQKQAQSSKCKVQSYLGPFVDGRALKQALKILRKVFPFRTCRTLPKKPCLYKELGLCEAPCELKVQSAKFKVRKNIKNLIKVLRGQKNSVVKNLQKEMRLASQKQNYEKANELKKQIMALENVFSHSHILKPAITERTKFLQETEELGSLSRIEGYDISNIQGQQATGGLVVFENGQPDKSQYRKFKIKITGQPNDTAMLKEMISRRLKHKEWPLSQVILIDGGKAQLNVALKLKMKNEKPQLKI